MMRMAGIRWMGIGIAFSLVVLAGCGLSGKLDPKFSLQNEIVVLSGQGEFLRKSPALRGAPMDLEWRSGDLICAVDGAGLVSFNPQTGELGDYFGHPRITEFDIVEGHEILGIRPVYITASYFERVIRLLDAEGRILRSIDAPMGVHDVDLLPNGNLLRVDARENRIVEITPHGQEVWTSTVDLLNPYEAVLTERGTIIIADFDHHKIKEIDRDSNVLNDVGGFNHPRRIQRVSEGYFVIADSDQKRIMAMTPDYSLIPMAEGLNRPLSVAFDPMRQLMIAGVEPFFEPPESVIAAQETRWPGYAMMAAIWFFTTLAFVGLFGLYRYYREPVDEYAWRGWKALLGFIARFSNIILSLGMAASVAGAWGLYEKNAVVGFVFLVIGLPLVWLSRCRRNWWFDAEPVQPDDEDFDDEDAPRGAVIRPWLLIAGIALSWLAFVWSRFQPGDWLPVLPWIAGPFLCVWAARKAYRGSFNPANFVWLIAIFAIALFFRTWRIDEQPYGLWLDEVYAVWNALMSFENETLKPFETQPLVRPNEFDITNMYLLPIALFAKQIDISFLMVKWISILPGLGIVWAGYCLGKWSFGDWAGRLAAFIIAVNSWQVTFARWGWLQQLYVMLALLAFAYIIRAYRWKCPRSAAISGLCIGLGFYTYLPIVITSATIVLLFAIAWFREDRVHFVKQFALWALLCGLVFAPLADYYRTHPGVFFARASSAGISNDVFNAKSLKPLNENIRRYLVAFHWEGDRNGRHNIPGEPMLDPVTGGLMLAGLLLCLYRFYRPGERMLLLAAGAAMAGGIFSMAVEAPNTFRLGVVGPVMCLWAALPLASLMQRREETAGEDAPARWPLALLALALIGMTAFGYYRYFVQHPSRDTWPSSFGAEQHLAYSNLKPEDIGREQLIVHPKYSNRTFNLYTLFLEADLRGIEHAKLNQATRYQPIDIKQRMPALGPEGLTLLMPPDYESLLRETFPDAEIEILKTPYGDINAVIARVEG